MYLYSVSAFAQVQTDNHVRDTLDTDSLVTETLIADSVLADSTLIDTNVNMTLQEQIDSLLKTDMFKTSIAGIKIWDITGDSLVYAVNDRQTLRTGSTMKLLTSITALDRLGGAYRFSTALKYEGTLIERRDSLRNKYKILIGDVTLRGGMDPRFGTDDMKAFIEALQKQNIDTIYGSIKTDMTFKDLNRLGSGWCWDDDNPCLTPLLWDEKDRFMDKFSEQLKNAGIVVILPFYQPHDSVFMAEVQKGKVISLTTLDTRYHSIDQIMMPMMKTSDNLYAESLFYQIAASSGVLYASAKNAVTFMDSLIAKVGLMPSSYRIADGSGLSLYNYQSPELQVEILRYAFKNKNIYTHLLPTLPIAGIDGTLKNRMCNAACKGFIHAKTGTVTGVSALAGYVFCENGSTLCFSIMNQGNLQSVISRNFQDKVCQVMYKYK